MRNKWNRFGCDKDAKYFIQIKIISRFVQFKTLIKQHILTVEKRHNSRIGRLGVGASEETSANIKI